MKYLLDTNVVSETVRPHPDLNVLAWLDTIPNEALYISALTLGEIRKGVMRMPDSKRKLTLRLWLENDLHQWFGDRVLAVDTATAYCWGDLQARMNRPLPAVDSLIAATALQHGLSLVTRNVQDFQFPNVLVINPWEPLG